MSSIGPTNEHTRAACSKLQVAIAACNEAVVDLGNVPDTVSFRKRRPAPNGFVPGDTVELTGRSEALTKVLGDAPYEIAAIVEGMIFVVGSEKREVQVPKRGLTKVVK